MAVPGVVITDDTRRRYAEAAEAMHGAGERRAHGQTVGGDLADATRRVDALCRTLPAPLARDVRALLDGYYDIAADHTASVTHCRICTPGPDLDTHSTGLSADIDADLDEVADFDTYTRQNHTAG